VGLFEALPLAKRKKELNSEKLEKTNLIESSIRESHSVRVKQEQGRESGRKHHENGKSDAMELKVTEEERGSDPLIGTFHNVLIKQESTDDPICKRIYDPICAAAGGNGIKQELHDAIYSLKTVCSDFQKKQFLNKLLGEIPTRNDNANSGRRVKKEEDIDTKTSSSSAESIDEDFFSQNDILHNKRPVSLFNKNI